MEETGGAQQGHNHGGGWAQGGPGGQRSGGVGAGEVFVFATDGLGLFLEPSENLNSIRSPGLFVNALKERSYSK